MESVSWKKLLESGRVEQHGTSVEELEDLRYLIERNLQDAAIPDLSDDRRFGIAYEAVLILCKLAIARAGYRVRGHAGHVTTLEAARLALGPARGPFFSYFEHCRRRRNRINYETAGCASRDEADELLEEARRFRTLVDRWVTDADADPPH